MTASITIPTASPVAMTWTTMSGLVVYAATAPDVEGGDYYGPDGIAEMRGFPRKVEAISAAHDPGVASRLWRVSEELTGVHYPLPD